MRTPEFGRKIIEGGTIAARFLGRAYGVDRGITSYKQDQFVGINKFRATYVGIGVALGENMAPVLFKSALDHDDRVTGIALFWSDIAANIGTFAYIQSTGDYAHGLAARAAYNVLVQGGSDALRGVRRRFSVAG